MQNLGLDFYLVLELNKYLSHTIFRNGAALVSSFMLPCMNRTHKLYVIIGTRVSSALVSFHRWTLPPGPQGPSGKSDRVRPCRYMIAAHDIRCKSRSVLSLH